jgi:hypothetical protein
MLMLVSIVPYIFLPSSLPSEGGYEKFSDYPSSLPPFQKVMETDYLEPLRHFPHLLLCRGYMLSYIQVA